jgi:D-sedoheptulose 7-phosphate isomerase
MVNIESLIKEHQNVISSLTDLIPVVERVGREMVTCLQNGGKIIFMGNGGSAADAQHLAAEFVGKFQKERKAYRAISLTTDTSILTAVANDYGYDEIFARQIDGLCKPGDVVVGMSTSGNSPNVIKGIGLANKIGALTVGFAGHTHGGQLEKQARYCVTIPSMVTARIQEAHILIGHILCEWVETELTGGSTDV